MLNGSHRLGQPQAWPGRSCCSRWGPADRTSSRLHSTRGLFVIVLLPAQQPMPPSSRPPSRLVSPPPPPATPEPLAQHAMRLPWPPSPEPRAKRAKSSGLLGRRDYCEVRPEGKHADQQEGQHQAGPTPPPHAVLELLDSFKEWFVRHGASFAQGAFSPFFRTASSSFSSRCWAASAFRLPPCSCKRTF